MVWVNLPFDGLDAASLFRTFGLQQQDDGSLVMFYTKLEQLPPVTHTGLVGWVQNALKMPSECEVITIHHFFLCIFLTPISPTFQNDTKLLCVVSCPPLVTTDVYTFSYAARAGGCTSQYSCCCHLGRSLLLTSSLWKWYVSFRDVQFVVVVIDCPARFVLQASCAFWRQVC